uniref:Uncharacterized protein n=1 Tax=viral metagenome TaxID=1070528 RepID=A0A6C0LG08_9ZZZZ|tara:strand:- start:1433 stop:2254 length:822 start_codon:yes stop_codon:yes gene_type:complete
MKILSIDVGIKNLAVCCIEIDLETRQHKILKWIVHDLSNNKINYCSALNKGGKICNKTAKYIKNDMYCCKTHAKCSDFCIPTSEMTLPKLKKKRVSELYTLANECDIEYPHKVTKSKLLEIFEDHIREKYFEVIKPIKIDDLHMITIGRNITNQFNETYNDIELDVVIIENQISPIANKMKTIQGMLAQYFIMSSISEIFFVSSINKLKLYEGCKNLTYKERKKKSIEICEMEIKNNSVGSENLLLFDKSNKKDDLADSYLQGLWYIKEKVFA